MRVLQVMAPFVRAHALDEAGAPTVPGVAYGSERSTLALCQGLKRSGHEVMLVCRSGVPLVDMASAAGVEVLPMPFGGRRSLPTVLRLLGVMRRFQPDVVATQLARAALHGGMAGRLARVPVVSTVRALNRAHDYERADRFIAVSEGVKAHLVGQGIAATKIDVVYNGVDLSQVDVATVERLKREHGLQDADFILGVVARLQPEKGHEWFLHAIAPVMQRVPGAKVVLVGDGPEKVKLQGLARQLQMSERVIFAGYQKEAAAWMAAFDVLVLPSVGEEGFGRVLVEAGALGKPVIATDVGGIPEVVVQGETGLLVPVNNDNALQDAVLRLADEPLLRARLGQAGRERVLGKFTAEQMVAGTVRVYEHALHSRMSA